MGAPRICFTNENSRDGRLAPAGKQITERDTKLRGFYRVRGSTCVTYYCQADCKNALGRKKTVRKRIEDVQLIDVDEARNEARLIIASIKAGKYQDNGEKPHDVTVRECWESYQQMCGQDWSPMTVRGYRKSMETVLGDLLDLPIKNLSATESQRIAMRERHMRETTDRGKYAANRAFQTLRAVHKHAWKRFDNVPEKPPTALVRFNKESRYEIADENVIAKFWTALQGINNPVKRSFYAILLLGGARPGDIKDLRWENVDFRRRTAFITKPKGGESRAFELVLSPPMIKYIEQTRYDDEWVFCGMKSPNSYREPSMPLPAGKYRNVYMAVAKSLHVDDLHLKKLVNHKVSDVTHGYAGQRSLLLKTLLAEQERISKALLAKVRR